MNNPIRYMLPAAIACAAFFLASCTADIAGGSEIGNPKVVTGMVTDSAGTGISGVAVYLVDPFEQQSHELLPGGCLQGSSDTSGRYDIPGVYRGVYNLMGIDSSGAAMFLRTVVLDATSDNRSDTVPCGIDTLTSAANVIVAVPGAMAMDSAVIFIPGTVIRVDVDTSGEYLIRCPASTIDIMFCSGDSTALLARNITVGAGQWLDLTGKHYEVPTPFIESGLISGFTGRVYSFSAGGITLGPDHPVHYRFDWGDAIAQWSLSRQGEHSWGEPGIYPVRVQARSVRDTASVSAWSAVVDVVIQ